MFKIVFSSFLSSCNFLTLIPNNTQAISLIIFALEETKNKEAPFVVNRNVIRIRVFEF